MTEIGPGVVGVHTPIDVLQSSTTPAYNYSVSGWLYYTFTATKDGAVRFDGLASTEMDGSSDPTNSKPFVYVIVSGASGGSRAGESGSPGDVYAVMKAGDVVTVQIVGLVDGATADGQVNLVLRASDWATLVSPAYTPAPVTVRPTSITFAGVPAYSTGSPPPGSITGANPGAVTDGSDSTYASSSYGDSAQFHFDPTGQNPVFAYATIRAAVNPFRATSHNLLVGTVGGSSEGTYYNTYALSTSPQTFTNISLRNMSSTPDSAFSNYGYSGFIVTTAFTNAAPNMSGIYDEMLQTMDVSVTMQMPDVPAVYHADLWLIASAGIASAFDLQRARFVRATRS